MNRYAIHIMSREFAREHGDPCYGYVLANSKEEAERKAADNGINAPTGNWAVLKQAEVLDWKIEKRWCGHHNCFCSFRTVISYGKWSVSGATGNFVVTGPDGWDIERKHPFQTEQEAKDFVEAQVNKTGPSAAELKGTV